MDEGYPYIEIYVLESHNLVTTEQRDFVNQKLKNYWILNNYPIEKLLNNIKLMMYL